MLKSSLTIWWFPLMIMNWLVRWYLVRSWSKTCRDNTCFLFSDGLHVDTDGKICSDNPHGYVMLGTAAEESLWLYLLMWPIEYGSDGRNFVLDKSSITGVTTTTFRADTANLLFFIFSLNSCSHLFSKMDIMNFEAVMCCVCVLRPVSVFCILRYVRRECQAFLEVFQEIFPPIDVTLRRVGR